MEETLMKSFLMSVSVVLLSALVGVIAWTVSIGMSIASDWEGDVVTYYSEAGLSIMVDASNLESLDAANLYKMMEVNRNIITDYRIQNLDGSYIDDIRDLLGRPTDRFSVVIRGDSAVGFEVMADEVEVEEVGH